MSTMISVTPLTSVNLTAIAAIINRKYREGFVQFTIDRQDAAGESFDPGEVPFPWHVASLEADVRGKTLYVTVWHNAGPFEFTEIILEEENRLGPAGRLLTFSTQAFLELGEDFFVLKTKGARLPTLSEAPLNERNRTPMLYDIRYTFRKAS